MNHLAANDIVAAMSALAVTHDLHARAFEGFRVCLAHLAADGQECLCGWAAKEIESRFRSCSLVFDNLLGYPFADTRLDLCVPDTIGESYRGLGPIGYYRLITALDGAYVDEYFVINVAKPDGN